jgi:flagellar hook-associated protein 1
MASYSTGLSALQANTQVLDIIGQNVSNANTPGYHRQVPVLTSRLPEELGGLSIGRGVDVTKIGRERNSIIEDAITQQTSISSSTTTQLQNSQQVESYFATGDGSLDTLLSNFFDGVEQLANQPDDISQRRVVLGQASAATTQINSLATNLDQLKTGLDSQIDQSVTSLNTLASQIATLNGSIQRNEIQGVDANDLRDQRDQLINQAAQLVDVKTIDQGNGLTTVLAGGLPLVLGTDAVPLVASTDATGNRIVTTTGSQAPTNITGGQLGGLLQLRNVSLPGYRSRLDALTQSLIKNVNQINATGIGLQGGLSYVAGQNAVKSITQPLANVGLAFPPTTGSLYVTVTNQSTGQRTLSQINIDPTTQSLTDVATAISGIPNLQALADSQTGELQILAKPGYTFNFAGQIPSTPDTVAITGTTTPKVDGAYTGTNNDVYTFSVSGSGTIGATQGLTLTVKNNAGTVVNSLNVGQGYEPGTALQVGNGVTVSLGAGTANAGDNFGVRIIGQPDTAGILPALGIGSFFTGKDATTIQVNANLINHPEQLAASTTGQAGDNTNLQKLAALRDQPTLANSTQSFGQFYGAIVGDVGTQVKQLTNDQTGQSLLSQRLQAEQQSVSGVDPNEELVSMLQFQNAFQMASKYISVVDTTMNSLLSIIQ